MDKELFLLAHKIAGTILARSNSETEPRPSPDYRWMEDWRKESVNPFYSQTESGLFLEMYYSLPNKLWTPLGMWGFGGSGSGNWDSVTEELVKRLGMKMYMPMYDNFMGQFGPVYELTKIDDVPLPRAKTRIRDKFIPYEEARDRWATLKQQSL